MLRFAKLSILTLFHPVTAFTSLKALRGRRADLRPVLIMLFLSISARVLAIYLTHYPLNSVDIRQANIVLETAVLFVPVLTWVLASYAMTTILSGETTLTENLLAMAYSLTPYILLTLPLTLLSLVMDNGMAALYNGLEVLILGWVLLLFVISLKEMNGYSMKKTLAVILVSLFTMALIWATAALVLTIVTQFITMVSEFIIEVRYAL